MSVVMSCVMAIHVLVGQLVIECVRGAHTATHVARPDGELGE